MAGTFHFIVGLTNDPHSKDIDDGESLQRYFGSYFVYKFFQNSFVVLFFYLLLGPVMVLIYHLVCCERDASIEAGGDNKAQDSQEESGAESPLANHQQGQGAEQDALTGADDESAVSLSLINLLEWIPLRLVGLTFSLAGDFTGCFNELKNTFISNDDSSSALLSRYAFAALGEDRQDEVPVVGDRDELGELVHTAESTPGNYTSINVGEDGELRAGSNLQLNQLNDLLNRSLIIWISIVALFTVYGVN